MSKKRNPEIVQILDELLAKDLLDQEERTAVNQAKSFYKDNTYTDDRDAFYAREMEDYVNSFITDEEKFAEACSHFHRTLQQSLMRLIVEIISKFATLDTDGRNERAVALAKKLDNVIKEDGGYMPFV